MKTSFISAYAALLFSALLLPVSSMADSSHGHENMSNQKHMEGRMVMGVGRINKVMLDRNMVNIVHEPIAELEWPKMRMNFKVSDQVKLDELKPGQDVEFKLQVNKDNSYLIKSIDVK